MSGILSVGYPNISVVSGILPVGHPSFSVVSGILSVVGIPPVPIPIPEEIQLLFGFKVYSSPKVKEAFNLTLSVD